MATENDTEQFKEAQLRLLESEIAKNKAQEKKLNSEADKIFEISNKTSLNNESIVKAIIGGIVAAALLAAWIIAYLQPIISRKNELAEIDSKVWAKQNELQKLINNQQSEKNRQDSIVIDSINQANTNLFTNLQLLKDALKYQEDLISNLNIELNNTTKQNNKLAQELNNKLKVIKLSQLKLDAFAANIDGQFILNWLLQNGSSNNPYSLIKKLINERIPYLYVGGDPVGVGHDYHGWAGIKHAIKTYSVTLPKDAKVIKAYPFVSAYATGMDLTTSTWSTSTGIDLGWLTMSPPTISENKEGKQVVSITIDNWRDEQNVVGFLLVIYQKKQ